jgi:predicted dehydrogenase
VLLEKPPTPTLAGFERLLEGLSQHGRVCQVGFQSLGSHAVSAVRALMAEGAVGRIVGIGAAGAWQRDVSYYARAPWAGRRSLGGVPVVDGALTNPFAHAAATALALDGDSGEEGLQDVGVELFRANPIEADDTSALRLVTARGTKVTVAVTLCADRVVEPYLVVHGTRGRITLHYRSGHVRSSARAK